MNLEISIEHHSWQTADVESVVDECVDCVFSELKLNRNNVEICFLFTDDEDIRTLNKTYRGFDKATNVLSFPADSMDDKSYDYCDISHEEDLNCKICILGSIAFAYETIEKEAKDQQKTFSDHLKHLVVHSVLHLLGYTHTNENDANNMELFEIKLLEKLNVTNPYE